MPISVTRVSGSVEQDDPDLAVPVDDGNDILRDCAGGCGQKVLFFGFLDSEEWENGVEGVLCMECRSKPLKHTPQGG